MTVVALPTTSLKPSLRVRPLGDLLTLDPPRRDHLLGSWLTRDHLAMVYAPSGVGKSFFVWGCALALAGGGRFLRWAAPASRKVLIIDGEMDRADLYERARTLLDALPEVDRKAASANLHLLAYQDQEPGTRFPDIADPRDHDRIIGLARDVGAALVVLDNFSVLARVANENDASSFDTTIDLMRRLKQSGVAVILVHHARKNANGEGSYRGTQKMSVTFQSIIRLGHPDGEPCPDGVAFDLTFEKFRGRRSTETDDLRASLPGGGEGRTEPPRWTCRAVGNGRVRALVAAVRSHAFRTQEAIGDHLGLSTGTVSKLKGEAIRSGLITEAEWKRRMDEARATVPETEDAGKDPTDTRVSRS